MQKIRSRQLARNTQLYESIGSSVQVGLGDTLAAAFGTETTFDFASDLVEERSLKIEELPQDVIDQSAQLSSQASELSRQASKSRYDPEKAKQLYEEIGLLNKQRSDLEANAREQLLATGKIKSAEQLTEEYGQYGINFDEDMGQKRVDFLVNRVVERETRQAYLDLGPSGIVPGLLTFGATLAAYIVDPIELTSAFIPIVGPVKYAAWVRRLGKYRGRALKGAYEGTAGAIMTEPLYATLGNQAQIDVSMMDSLFNIGIGTVLGSGFGTAVGRFARGTPEAQAKRIYATRSTASRSSYNSKYLNETARLALNQGLLTGRVDVVNLDARSMMPIVEYRGLKYQGYNSLPETVKVELEPSVFQTNKFGDIKIYKNKGNAERYKGDDGVVVPYNTTARARLTRGEIADGSRQVAGYVVVKKVKGEIIKRENGQTLTFKTREEAQGLIKNDSSLYDYELRKPKYNAQVVEIPTAKGKRYGVALNMSKDDVDFISRQTNPDTVMIRSGVDATQTSALTELDGGLDSIRYGAEAEKIIADRVNERLDSSMHPDDVALIDRESTRYDEMIDENIDDSIDDLEARVDDIDDADILEIKKDINEVIREQKVFIDTVDRVLKVGVSFLSGDGTSKKSALQKMKDAYKSITGTSDAASSNRIKIIHDRLNKIVTDRQANLDEPLSKELSNNLAQEGINIASLEASSYKEIKRQLLMQVLAISSLQKRALKALEITGDASIGIEAALVSIARIYEGSGISVESSANVLRNHFVMKFEKDLSDSNVRDLFMHLTDEDQKLIANTIEQINRKNPVKRENLSIKVSDNIFKISQIMTNFNNEFRIRKNKAGASIGDLQGYITKQTHNRKKIQDNKDLWIGTLKEKLDFNAMKIPQGTMDEALERIYESIINPSKPSANKSNILNQAITLPSNLATRLQQERVLIFKTGADWFTYNKEFGSGKSLAESFILDMESTARQVSLLETFGPNPGYVLDKLITNLSKLEGQRINFERKGAFKQKLETMLDYASGYTNIAEHEGYATTGRLLRAWQTMSKLGGSVLASVTDPIVIAFQQKSMGKGLGESLYNGFSAFWIGRLAKKDLAAYGEFTSIGLDTMLGSYVGRMNTTDTLDGTLSRVMQSYFKLNLLAPWTENAKVGVAMIIARDIAKQSSRQWKNVDVDLRRILERYNITENNWNTVRRAVKTYPDGKKYISPSAFDNLGLKADEAEKLKFNLIALLDTEADIAVVTPGAREQIMVTGGYRPGTGAGEAIRTVMQFKAFPISFQTKVMNRQRYAYGQGQSGSMADMNGRGFLGMAQLVAGMTIMGYFAIQAKEMARGKKPRPWSKELLLNSFVQGGGGMLYGDILFSEATKYGRDPFTSQLGPTVGTASDLLSLYGDAMTPDGPSAASLKLQAVGLTRSNIPFANLFYTREVFNYLFWYQLQEAASPGYLQRVERYTEEEGQEYFFKPSNHVN